jgi:uncharacterized protein (TIGR03435 family)
MHEGRASQAANQPRRGNVEQGGLAAQHKGPAMKELRVFTFLVALGQLGSPASAQAPVAPAASPRFEVASIKRNNSGTGFITIGMQPGGRMNFVNVPLRQLIMRAYLVQPFQIIGGPDWIGTDRFDVIAKAETDVPPDQLNLMLRSLLADRFRLVVHTETRELPVYYLVKARTDGALGASLKAAAVDCGAMGRGRGGLPALPPPGRGGGAGPQPPLADCRALIAPGRLTLGGQPLAQLASMLGIQVGRPVIDKTGLAGGYDLELTFMPEGRGGIPPGPLPPGAPDLPPIDPDAPSLFTALQEQLGLKLESARGPVEVIVVDSAQQPTED